MSLRLRFARPLFPLALLAASGLTPACAEPTEPDVDVVDSEVVDANQAHTYNHLLVIQQTEQPIGIAKVQNYTLYKLTDGAAPAVLATSVGFSGGHGTRTATGFWFVNIARRGRTTQREGSLAAFHDGIQEIASEGYHGSWGSLRANLSRSGKEGREPRGPAGDTRYYIHGMKTHVQDPSQAYTWGCSADPSEKMLQAIFALDPAAVRMDGVKGRLAVWIGRGNEQPPLRTGGARAPAASEPTGAGGDSATEQP